MAKIKSLNNNTKQDVILQAAANLFREKGFAAATMRDLAEKVGVEAASLYNHIRSKNELLQKICASVALDFTTHMESVQASKQNSISKLEQILRFHIRQLLTNFEHVLVSDKEWRHLPEPYLSNHHNIRRQYRKNFAAIIEQGIKNKEIKKIDAPTAVLVLLHSVNGIESWHRSTQKISANELEENMVLILIEGLKR